MTIHPRPTPIRPTVESFGELQAWIDRRLDNIESDLSDGETMGHLGSHGTVRLHERRSTLLDVAHAIRDALAAEASDQATEAADESIEQRFKDAYGPEPLAPYQAEGR